MIKPITITEILKARAQAIVDFRTGFRKANVFFKDCAEMMERHYDSLKCAIEGLDAHEMHFVFLKAETVYNRIHNILSDNYSSLCTQDASKCSKTNEECKYCMYNKDNIK